jgi:hypothetical protein
MSHNDDNSATKKFTVFTLDTAKFDTVHHLTNANHFRQWKRNMIEKTDLVSLDTFADNQNPITADMIYVANPTFYKSELYHLVDNKRVNTYNTTAQLLFRRLGETSANDGFNVMWLDYCCTWYGNELCCPIQDIGYIFQHRILKTRSLSSLSAPKKSKSKKSKKTVAITANSKTNTSVVSSDEYAILMITLSKRVPNPLSDTTFASPELENYEANQSLNLVLRDVPRLAKQHSLVAEFQTSRQYGQMLFVYFRISE